MPAGPEIPEWADPRELDPSIRAALRGLDARNATQVAGHLVVAGTLVDEDPVTALAHARAARDRASRLAVVREAVGVAAYHAEDYAEAARELRAYRRMSGDPGYRAVLADCERAMGRPEVALRLVAEALAENPDAEETVELRLVEAGARRDLGEHAAARIVLETALGGRPDPAALDATDEGQLRIAAAYADLLRDQGDEERADQWLAAVAAIDPELAGEDLRVEFTEVEFSEFDDEGGDALEDGPEDVAEDADALETVASDEAENSEVAGEAPARSSMSFDEEVEAEVAELLGETTPDTGDTEN
ncbi:tetratricopeptide repeat protein [Blastococcus sp. TBT05-19]|uniref:tetratricopeptide repeat protein n=1 Tax=Blastococcus sp. TBT05-19 TaxID=2250581 RepID=UPI001313F31C|nr:tetratricopeptide repeat protein [Blastococcus sp. TBT05-19]